MALTDRDRKVLMAIIPILVLLGYYFLLLSPKRATLNTAKTDQAAAQAVYDQSRVDLQQGQVEKKVYRTSYAQVLRLGKAVPADADVASLIVQIQDLAKASNVDFSSLAIAEGGASTSLASVAAAAPAEAGASGSTGAAGATGATGSQPTALTGVGRTKQRAENARDATDQQGAKAGGEASPPAITAAPTSADLTAEADKLKVVTFSLEFSGGFFDLDEFFGRIHRMVRRDKDKVRIHGRLLQISSINLGIQEFPRLSATVQMTGYQLPRSEDPVAGATPDGPGASPPTAGATGV